MAQSMVSFRMDAQLKKDMEETCRKMGLTMTAAFTMFAAKVTMEQRIPFTVTADPFYSEKNQERLKKAVQELREGKGHYHELIEAEE